jgi:hypothetical protein
MFKIARRHHLDFGDQRDIARYVAAIFAAIDKPKPVALTRSINMRRYYLAQMS